MPTELLETLGNINAELALDILGDIPQAKALQRRVSVLIIKRQQRVMAMAINDNGCGDPGKKLQKER